MQAHQGKYVRDLKAWELPRLDDLESEMVEALAIEARAIYGDRVFGDYVRFFGSRTDSSLAASERSSAATT